MNTKFFRNIFLLFLLLFYPFSSHGNNDGGWEFRLDNPFWEGLGLFSAVVLFGSQILFGSGAGEGNGGMQPNNFAPRRDMTDRELMGHVLYNATDDDVLQIAKEYFGINNEFEQQLLISRLWHLLSEKDRADRIESENVIKNFCSENRWKLDFHPDWSTPQKSSESLGALKEKYAGKKRYWPLRKYNLPCLRDEFYKKYIDKNIKYFEAIINSRLETDRRRRDEIARLEGENELFEGSSGEKRELCRALAKKKESYFPGVKSKSFPLSDSVRALAQQGMLQESLYQKIQSASGTEIQLYIHEEVVDSVNEISDLYHADPDAFNVKNYSEIVFQAADAALECSEKREFRKAYFLSDLCSVAVDAARKVTGIVARGLGKGVDSFGKHGAMLVHHLLSDPVETIANVAKSIGSGIHEVVKEVDKLCVPEKYYLQDKKHLFSRYGFLLATRKAHTVDVAERVSGKIAACFEKLKDDPEGAAVDLIAWCTELGMQTVFFNAGVAKVAALAKPVAEAVRNELAFISVKLEERARFAKGIIDVEATVIPGTDLATVPTGEALDLCRQATRQNSSVARNLSGGAATRKATSTKTISSGPQQIPPRGIEDLAIVTAKQELAVCAEIVEQSEFITWDSIHHVLKGEIKEGGKRVGGMHTVEGFEHFAKTLGRTTESYAPRTLENGLIEVGVGGKTKTLFPRGFSHAEIVRKMKKAGEPIVEGLRRIVDKGGTVGRYAKETSVKGWLFKVKIVIDYSEATNRFKLITMYPLAG